MPTKSVWLSKTLWVNLVLAVLAFIPAVSEVVKNHPDYVIAAFSVINMVLRLVSHGKLELS